jgi:phosphatidylserine decarboxylase
MKDALIVSALSLLPRKTVASGMGSFARSAASRWITRTFVSTYGVDLSEATGSLDDYDSLESLFTRTLKPGARPIADRPDALVSPVDGTVAAVGVTRAGKLELVPGRMLDVPELLGHAGRREWDTAVLYLSPTDYHRVHVPREGHAVDWSYLPGTLWPVFPAAVRKVDGLFSRNERFRVGLQTTDGPRVEVVLVGAFGVGRISVGLTDTLSNAGFEAAQGTLETPAPAERGDWLGTFHLGSTVILAAPPGSVRGDLQVGQKVKMGESIGGIAVGSQDG